MQETKKHTRVTRHTRINSDKGAESVNYKKRKARTVEKASPSNYRTRTDYLNQTFENVLASKVGCILTNIEPKTKDPVYLYESVKNYFHLMDKPFNIVPSGCFELDAFNIYYALRDNLPETIGVNFDNWKGKLSVILFDDDIKFPDYTLFYIPVCGIENMSEQLRAAFLHFLSFVRHTQKIDIPSENRDFDYVVTEYGEEYEEECMEADNWEEMNQMRKRYNSGDISFIMSEISDTKFIESNLESELNKLLAEDTIHADEGLLSIMISGIKLLRQDCIFNYDYYPETDNYSYYTEVIEFDRSFCFCWGNEDNDLVVQMVIDFYNNEEQEYATYGPAAYLVLAPDTDRLLEKSDFPTRFAKWYSTFYEELQKYIGNGTTNE